MGHSSQTQSQQNDDVSVMSKSVQGELRQELLATARDELDRRISAREWTRLTKRDLAWWLEARGCSMRFALEDDSVDIEVSMRL